jgi:NhaA family Na+:H+ antiporter
MHESSPRRSVQLAALDRVVAPLRDFLHAETSGGIVLLAAAVIALVWANSPLSGSYSTYGGPSCASVSAT